MTKNSNIDKLTKDILKSSYLEVTDPDFNQIIMKRILRESRKRRVLENFLLCFLVFVAVDAIILLVLWVLGLNVFDVALKSGDIPHEFLLRTEKLKDVILQKEFMKYIYLLLGIMAVVYGITESISNVLERPKHGRK